MDQNIHPAIADFNAVVPLPPILIADDDPADLFFAVHLVKRTGTRHPVMTFDDGLGVTDYLTHAWLRPSPAPSLLLPRLLFLDLKMTGLGGFEFLRWMAQHPELSAIHVVVLSGSDEPADVERAKALGAKRYLAKHPTVGTFARIIGHAYGDSALPTELRDRHAENGFFQEGADPDGSDRLRQRVTRIAAQLNRRNQLSTGSP